MTPGLESFDGCFNIVANVNLQRNCSIVFTSVTFMKLLEKMKPHGGQETDTDHIHGPACVQERLH